MKLLLEIWKKQFDETLNQEIEKIVESFEVSSEEEAKSKAEDYKKQEGVIKITLHKCQHEEGLPCERIEL